VNGDLRAEPAQIMDEVEGETVVVVDEDDHVAPIELPRRGVKRAGGGSAMARVVAGPCLDEPVGDGERHAEKNDGASHKIDLEEIHRSRLFAANCPNAPGSPPQGEASGVARFRQQMPPPTAATRRKPPTDQRRDGPAALPPPTVLRVRGGLSAEGAPPCPARPPCTQ
jgi:hypothetical protein